MSQQRLDKAGHERRADRHAKVAAALEAAGDEWSAVCYFYAAYHVMRGAILDDVAFDDITACQSIDADLLPHDRYTSRHKGRRQTAAGREWGVNELVLKLFGARAAGPYERLHQASIDVRYHEGLRGSIAAVRESFDAIRALQEEGSLGSNPPSLA